MTRQDNQEPFTVMSLLERVHSLEKQIEKMKCCYNCKYSESDNKSLTICDECFELCYCEMKE